MSVLVLSLLWLLSQLPYRWLLKVGPYLGIVLSCFDPKSYRVALANIQHCFPELSSDEHHALLKRNYAALGIAMLESALAWWAPEHRLHHLLEVDGLEHVAALQREGRGAIVISAHFMSLELVGRLMMQFAPFTITYRAQKKSWAEAITRRARAQHYQRIIERAKTRAVIRALHNKEFVFYAGDVDVGRKGLFVPFFNMLASTSDAPLRYAVLGDAAMMTAFFYRKPEGGYRLVLSRLDNLPSDDPQQDLLHINAAIESAIRVAPEQYLWQYRRFKTQPHEGLSFYDSQ